MSNLEEKSVLEMPSTEPSDVKDMSFDEGIRRWGDIINIWDHNYIGKDENHDCSWDIAELIYDQGIRHPYYEQQIPF